MRLAPLHPLRIHIPPGQYHINGRVVVQQLDNQARQKLNKTLQFGHRHLA
jgi:hypothetical protein